jgi:WD40 repeat protein
MMDNKENTTKKENKEIVDDTDIEMNKNENEEDEDDMKGIDELSVEEFEEEDIDYIDDGLVDNDDIENIQNDFGIPVIKENDDDLEEYSGMEIEEEPFHREFENFRTEGEIYGITMNDKGMIVVGDGEDNTYFYDVNKKELIGKEKFNKDSVIAVSFSNCGKFLATASFDGTVNLFETEEYKLMSTVNGSFSDINVINYFIFLFIL